MVWTQEVEYEHSCSSLHLFFYGEWFYTKMQGKCYLKCINWPRARNKATCTRPPTTDSFVTFLLYVECFLKQVWLLHHHASVDERLNRYVSVNFTLKKKKIVAQNVPKRLLGWRENKSGSRSKQARTNKLSDWGMWGWLFAPKKKKKTWMVWSTNTKRD